MPSLDTPVPVGAFALLFLAFAVKQLGADFLLQSSWMAQGKERGSDWLVPLCAHTGLHGLRPGPGSGDKISAVVIGASSAARSPDRTDAAGPVQGRGRNAATHGIRAGRTPS